MTDEEVEEAFLTDNNNNQRVRSQMIALRDIYPFVFNLFLWDEWLDCPPDDWLAWAHENLTTYGFHVRNSYLIGIENEAEAMLFVMRWR